MMRRASAAPLLLLTAAANAQQDKPPAGAWTAGYDDGFYARSVDGRNEITLEGLFQVDYVAYERTEERDSEFVLRRMRPELAGRLDDRLRFRLEPNFREDDVELEEAWVGAELGRRDTILMFGRMKAPFGLEEVRSRRHVDFPRFSILNQFAPAEDHGVFLYGAAGESRLEYGFAAYNGTGDSDTTSSKDVAARVMVHPWNGVADSALRNLQLGVAGTWGRQDEALDGSSVANAFGGRTLTWSSGTRLDGDRFRVGAELAWFDGPAMLQAEWLLVRQDVSLGGTTDTVQFQGAYLNVGVVLTGEDKSFRGVRPRNPLGGGGTGAFVAAVRLSALEADSSLRDLGFVEAGTFTRGIRSCEIGLDWIPDRHAIVRAAYVHCFYDDTITIGGRPMDDEGALLVEWQLHF